MHTEHAPSRSIVVAAITAVLLIAALMPATEAEAAFKETTIEIGGCANYCGLFWYEHSGYEITGSSIPVREVRFSFRRHGHRKWRTIREAPSRLSSARVAPFYLKWNPVWPYSSIGEVHNVLYTNGRIGRFQIRAKSLARGRFESSRDIINVRIYGGE